MSANDGAATGRRDVRAHPDDAQPVRQVAGRDLDLYRDVRALPQRRGHPFSTGTQLRIAHRATGQAGEPDVRPAAGRNVDGQVGTVPVVDEALRRGAAVDL